ncbi:LOW QUALITY PROTEIN: neural-cadherin-like [Pecten maximus]|uniref:LOW QUALITY PROTEIN: neural-cadherin-like n=1 Tax=Pecten maximus TaxID=6579 RepID=UPI001457EA48|nr:LOW QUALITY PROTEIN: neural-cadherin-like [Pecten maximus]
MATVRMKGLDTGLFCIVFLTTLIGLIHSTTSTKYKKIETNVYVPFKTPPSSIITKLSVSGKVPVLESLDETARSLFKMDKGQFMTNADLTSSLGKKFTFYVRDALESGPILDVLHVVVDNSTDMFTFPQLQYIGTIKENQPSFSPVEVVGHIWSRNHNSASLGHIKYSIIHHSGPSDFHLKHKIYSRLEEVKFVARKPLDREENNHYRIIVQAENDNGQKAQAVVKIFVLDENDNIPKFEKSSYSVEFGAAIYGGRKVIQVRAFDMDDETISYKIADENGLFIIDPISGKVFLKRNGYLDSGKYIFYVVARDSIGHSSDPVSVEIKVIPKALKFVSFHNHPQSHRLTKRSTVINRVEKTYEVPESMPSSKAMFSIASTPPPLSGVEQYSLMKSSLPDTFQVDTRGNVYIRQGRQLDYEDMQHRVIGLKFHITNSNNFQDLTELAITLKVTDTNDERPIFVNQPRPFLATVSTNPSVGEMVYELLAYDPDTGSDIKYILESAGERKFAIQNVNVNGTNVGRIITTVSGNGQFERGRVYELVVSARDMSALDATQKSDFEIVQVLVGNRSPQFFENPYIAYVSENNQAGYKLQTAERVNLKIQAKPFQSQQGDHSVRFHLYDERNQPSSLFAINEVGEVETLQSMDYEASSWKQFTLTLNGTEESTGLTSSTQLIVNLEDSNDNSPVFGLSTYTNSTSEGTPINATLFSVIATDRDSGENAELTYEVNNDNFYVVTRYDPVSDNYIGDLKVAKRLDYDFHPDRLYKFNVTATDHGALPKKGWASVVIYVTNINDEKPRFGTGLGEINASIREDLAANNYVTMVQAVDPDGDNVEYFFTERLTKAPNGPFIIDPKSGVIQLSNSIPPAIPRYVLNITAYDDGSCCDGHVTQRQDAVLIVEIKDINNNNPGFPSCNYQPNVMENQPIGTRVVQVRAEDNDRGPNGQITYSVVTPAYQTKNFDVDPDNGTVVTNIVFDRESEQGSRGYPVTIKAEDKGQPQQLNSLCTFWVHIDDRNDNRPMFDSLSYSKQITRTFEVNKRVTGVLATDRDMGQNAEVTYLFESNPGNYFRIEEDTGSIFLDKSLIDFPYTSNQTSVIVMAKDNGNPPLNSTVRVTISLAASQGEVPTWDESYDGMVYVVEETVPSGHTIGRFTASSNILDPQLQGVSFALIKSDGSQSQFDDMFRISTSSNLVKLKLRGNLDYNHKNMYTVRLRVTNKGLNPASNEMRVTVKVKDMNNQPPRFEGLDPTMSNTYRGSVPENEPVGQTVITVKAVDADHDPPNNEVRYSIIEDRYGVHRLFDINPLTGLITTNFTFDREVDYLYYIDIKAVDGKPSDVRDHEPPNTPNSATAQVLVVIGDKNDNTPRFQQTLYEKEVQEQPPDSSKAIIRVLADDLDSSDVLTYTITSGNVGNVFGIKQKTGEIYVARDLDYETPPKVYNLTITANDGYHTNTTRVKLTVLDINDNQPEFTQAEYIIKDVVEEIDPPAGQQKFLVQVSATDKDIDRPHNFRYSLNIDDQDPGNPMFVIGPEDGRIFLKRSLDRDLPNGRAEYQFNIIVEDEPGNPQSLIGYAYVKVQPKDINDNAPLFVGNLTGYVPENSAKRKNIMTVRAKDFDLGMNGTVYYQIDGRGNTPANPDNGEYLFKIQESSGLVYSNTDILNREVLDRYHLQVIAVDRGVPQRSSTATLTIKVSDENDEAPVFLQKIYRVTLSESQKSGPVITVSATDDDIGENAKLTYTLQSDLSFFSITTLPSNAGVINVFHPVDYENVQQRFFNLTVKARDSNPLHEDHAFVEITVTDANDEPPKFTDTVKIMDFNENIEEGTLLYTFAANDKDSPPNNDFTFAIADYSDRFYVEQQGNKGFVKIQKGLDGQTLDRETSSKYTVEVLAIDKGDPPLTGTATLILNVADLNDEAPTFAENYRPIVMEDDPFPQQVLTFKARDRDTRAHGPPFKFYLPACRENPTCDSDGNLNFTLVFNQSGDGSNGTGTIYAQNRFLREEKKFYYLPIVMTDMGGYHPLSMTGTSTLTIEIGDKNNNQHSDGSKDIFVYNYKGLFGNIEIGRANANDPDDWDFKDKWYYFIGPKDMTRFFSVSKENGTIMMKKGVPGGYYEFKVLVYDHVVFTHQNATATIHVTVQEIDDDAVFSSGSVRLSGTSAEEFMEERPEGSSYNRFKSLLARRLGVREKNVAIFSVMNNGSYTDIRYAAHGSPWYPASKLDGIVMTYKDEFETVSGGKIAMVSIDLCVKEVCESGGCTNTLFVDSRPSLVNTKGQSFVGVSTMIKTDCICKARDFSEPLVCKSGYCYNGGTCVRDNWGEVTCQCLSGFDGKRCQKTRHSFKGGYALYPALAQCEESTTSIEFITTSENGLIFYNGPVEPIGPNIPRDFIALELIKGYPQLQVDHGTGKVMMPLDGKDKNQITRLKKLNDGVWHHIDIVRKGRMVTMTVDQCQASVFERMSESNEDRQPCEITGSTRGRNKYLNVNTMLQMGGRYITPPYPTGITNQSFFGCIRNLYHNGELYDLYTSRNHPGLNHENDCPQEDRHCEDERRRSVCGPHGTCELVHWNSNDFKCQCKPGYRPKYKGSNKCDTNTTVRDLKDHGFMSWVLKNEMFNTLQERTISVEMSFRTRDADGGILLHLPSTSKEYITLEIVNNHLQVTFNLKDHDAPLMPNVLSLSAVRANNGQWHHVKFIRTGKWFQLKMDGGEGRYYNETWGKYGESQKFHLRSDQIVAGARVVFDATPTFDKRGLKDTCITDIRVDDKWFPMRVEENLHSPAANLSLYPNVQMNCVRDDDCTGHLCSSGTPISKECVPLWGDRDCRCPAGSEPGTAENCIPILYCNPNPCYSGGTCIELDYPDTFMCNCPAGWTGMLCNQQAQSEVIPAGVTTEALVIIIVSIFTVALIVMLVFLLVWNLTKRDKEKSILYDDQYDDIRENVMDHDEEGAGEEDQDGYDISRLRKPDQPFLLPSQGRPDKVRPGETPDVGSFIEDRLIDADHDLSAPPHDNVMEFAYEGGDSDLGSLSSLHTSSSGGDQDYEYLDDWGPKFSKLADMYQSVPTEESL